MKVDYERKDKSKTQIEIVFEIPKKELKEAYEKKVSDLSKNVEMKGFRKGKAPKEFAETNVSSQAQQEALEELLPNYAIEIMKEEDIQPAAPLSYEIESVNLNEGAKIKASIPVVPPFKLPDLKKAKSKVKKQPTSVSDKEVEEVIKHFWEEHRGKHENKDDKWAKEVGKKIGLEVKSMDELTSEIKKSVKSEKERIVAQKYASDLLSQAIEIAGIEVPEEMVHMETHAREDSFKQQLEQMKISAEQFCQIRGVTMDQLKEQWEKDSKEALLSDIFLSKYAQEKDIKVTDEELKSEIEMIKSRSPNADTKVFDNPQWKKYIERVVLKRKAHQAFLEEVDPEFFKKK